LFAWQLQLQREAEERRLKEEEEKKEKLRLLRERKEMEKKASYLLRNTDLTHNKFNGHFFRLTCISL